MFQPTHAGSVRHIWTAHLFVPPLVSIHARKKSYVKPSGTFSSLYCTRNENEMQEAAARRRHKRKTGNYLGIAGNYLGIAGNYLGSAGKSFDFPESSPQLPESSQRHPSNVREVIFKTLRTSSAPPQLRVRFFFGGQDVREPAGRTGFPRSQDSWRLPPQSAPPIVSLCSLCSLCSLWFNFLWRTSSATRNGCWLRQRMLAGRGSRGGRGLPRSSRSDGLSSLSRFLEASATKRAPEMSAERQFRIPNSAFRIKQLLPPHSSLLTAFPLF